MNFNESLQKLRELLIEDISGLHRLLISLFIAGLILVIFLWVSKKLKKLIVKRLSRKGNDHLLVEFIAAIVRGLIILFALTLIFRFFGLSGLVSGILAGAGITAFIIGFALKDIGENFLAGVLLAFKRPFRVGDLIEITGIRGRVLTLNLRDTHIKTADGKDVFLPNANIIKNPLTNFTIDGFLAFQFEVNITKGADYEKVLTLIVETVKQVPGVLKGDRSPRVHVQGVSGKNLTLSVSYWVNTQIKKRSDSKVRSEAILAVVKALEEAEVHLG